MTSAGAYAIRIRCDGPFAAGLVAWQRRSGETVFTVVVKATYALESELCPLLDESEALQEDDGFWDDDAARVVTVTRVRPRGAAYRGL